MFNKVYISLLVSLFFINCSSDSTDMGEVPEEFSVVGTWKLTSYTFENRYDFNKDGTSSNDFMLETACFDNNTITLNANRTGESIVPAALEFSFTGPNEYIMSCSSSLTKDPLTWSVEGDVLTVQGSVSAYKATIDGNTFTLTKNADQLVQALFGPDFKDNETIVYTKQ